MTRKLSVTAALQAANLCVGFPMKFDQYTWQVFYHEPDEAATRTLRAGSYSKALAMMVETKALIAIELLGESWGYQWDDGPDINVYADVCDGMNWREAVKQAHKQAIA